MRSVVVVLALKVRMDRCHAQVPRDATLATILAELPPGLARRDALTRPRISYTRKL
jgi:hypothetical protein